MGPEGTGAEYGILGPGGPHHSIHGGKTECVPDLTERSSPTLEPVCIRLKSERLRSASHGATEYVDEELPNEEEEVVVKLPKDMESEKTGVV